MPETPCELVVKHEGLLAGMVSDISHIKRKVDNGLSSELEKVSGDLRALQNVLNAFINKEGIRNVKSDAAVLLRQSQQDNENWFSRLLTGSVTKLIGYLVIFVILNSLASGGAVMFMKDKYSGDLQQGQTAILQNQESLKRTLDIVYHSHLTTDGKILMHADDKNVPAWLQDPKTGMWSRVPDMRVHSK